MNPNSSEVNGALGTAVPAVPEKTLNLNLGHEIHNLSEKSTVN